MFKEILYKILCKILGHESPPVTFETVFCGFNCQRCERFIKSKIDNSQSLIPYKVWSLLMGIKNDN